MPILSPRRNIVVIADEAHRSQYSMVDGFARNMRDALPNASFIGFTGTPIEKHDANTRSVFGDPKRIDRIAADLVEHYEKRIEALDGKAMVVCMSRCICVELYDAIAKIRPQWVGQDNDALKVVMTGSAEDGPLWQPHIRSKQRRRELANRFKDPKDPFRVVIVRDTAFLETSRVGS
jgi:type I site-specific restriction-modification system R (restriction) subunit